MKNNFCMHSSDKDFYVHEKYGIIPKGWIAEKGKHLFDIYGSISLSDLKTDDNGNGLYMKVDDFNNEKNSYYIEDTTTKIDISEKTKGVCPVNSIVISKRGEAIRKNRVRLTKHPTLLDPNLMALKVRGENDSVFFKYLIEFMNLQRFLEDSTVPQLNNKDFRPRLFIKPQNINEQRAITFVLSKVDEAIRAADVTVRATRKLKKALMQNLLTGKLCPDGTWRNNEDFCTDDKTGKIPIGWEKIKGQNLFKIYGSTSLSQVKTDEKGDSLYMKVSDYNLPGNEFFIKDTSVRLNFSDNHKLKLNYCKRNFIVISKRGEAIRQNRVRIISRKTLLDPNLMAFEIVSGNPFFYKYLIEYMNLQRFLENSALPQLNNKDFYPIWFLKPDLKQQNEIADILFSVDENIRFRQTKIRKLRRLKKALMQNLLTGKVLLKKEYIERFKYNN